MSELKNMEKLKDFWIQPSKGFTEETKGVTEEQIYIKEQEMGFNFPESYRNLMKVQNGGYLRKHTINKELGLESFEKLKYVDTGLEYMYITKNDEDLEEMYSQYKFCNPKRLISFASLYGHGVVCFDYGWLEKDILNEPKIILIEDDGEDFLDYGIVVEYKNFDDFLSQFKHKFRKRYWSETALIIQTELDIENFMATLQSCWGINFQIETDDRYGWFNFEKYYHGTVPLVIDDQTLDLFQKNSETLKEDIALVWVKDEGRKQLIRAVFSPNRHISGTYLFPEKNNANIVIEIKNPWFSKALAVENLKNELKSNQDLKIKEITLHNNV